MCKCEKKNIVCDYCEKLYLCYSHECFNSKGFTNKIKSCDKCYVMYKKCKKCKKANAARATKCIRCMRYHKCVDCNDFLHILPTCNYSMPVRETRKIDKNKPILAKYIKKLYGASGYVVSIKILENHIRYSYTTGCSCCGQLFETFNFIGSFDDISKIFQHYCKTDLFIKDFSINNDDGYEHLKNYQMINKLMDTTQDLTVLNNIQVFFNY
jgi:hypothetical protein